MSILDFLLSWNFWKAVVLGGVSAALAAMVLWWTNWLNGLAAIARVQAPLIFGANWETQLNKLLLAVDVVKQTFVFVENFFPVKFLFTAVVSAYLLKLSIRLIRHLLGLIPVINAG